jgi:hypothetical protein
MQRVELMREHAAQCLRAAEDAPTPQHKALLIGMAQAWLALAEQTERVMDIAQRVPDRTALRERA